MRLVALSLVLSALSPLTALAEGLDAPSEEALMRTEQLLTDPELREKAAALDSDARFVDQQVKSVAGTPENEQAIYELASKIMGSMAQETGGDPLKMMELLHKYKSDPKSLEEKLTPEQRKMLSEISKKIPARPAGGRP